MFSDSSKFIISEKRYLHTDTNTVNDFKQNIDQNSIKSKLTDITI